MKDDNKTKAELINELVEARQKISGLESFELECKKMEETMRKNEEKYRIITENHIDLIDTRDMEGIIQFVSPSYCRTLGKTEEELIGTQSMNLVHEDDREKTAKAMEGLFKSPYRCYVEQRVKTKDGWRWCGWAANAVLDDNNNVTSVVSVGRDVTERKQADEALRKSEERYKELAESISDVFYAMDKDLKYTYWNKSSEKLTGITAKEAIGKSLYELFPDIKGTKAEKAYLKVLKTKKVQSFENAYRIDNKDNFFEISAYSAANGCSVFTKDITERKKTEEELNKYRDHLEELVKERTDELTKTNKKLIEEITERKQAEEDLRESEQQLSRIYDSVGVVLFYLAIEPDDCFRFLSINQLFLDSTGLAKEQIVGKRIEEVIPEPSVGMVRDNYKKAIKEKRIVRWEEISEYPTGVKVGEVSIMPFFNDVGICTHLVGSVHDITERKQAEETIKRRLEIERTVSNVNSRFVGVSDIDEAINSSLSDIGRLSRASRAYMFLLRESGLILDDTHEWCAEGVASQISILRSILSDRISLWMGKLRDGRIIHITDVTKLRSEAETEKEILKALDIRSLLVLPLNIGQELAGFVGFDRVKEAVSWSEEDLALLRMVAEVIANALERRRTEELISTQRDLGLALNTVSGFEEGLKLCMEASLQVSRLDSGGIYLIDDDSGCLDLVYSKGLSSEFIRVVKHYEADSPSFKLVIGGKAKYTRHNELGVPLHTIQHREGLKAIGVIPIFHEAKVMGCLNVASHSFEDVPMFARKALETIAMQIGNEVDRLKAESALRRSEQRYRQLVETIPHGIEEIDNEGNITFSNHAHHSMLGYSDGELLGLNIRNVLPEEERDRVLSEIATLSYEQPKPTQYTYRNLTKDGRLIDVDVAWDYKRNGQGDVEGFVAIITDVTERKRAEEEVRLHRDNFAHVARVNTMGELTTSIAHELNQPLSAILTNAQVGRRLIGNGEPDLAELNDILGDIIGDNTRASEVIKRLRALAGKDELKLESIDLNEVVREVVDIVKNDLLVKSVSISIELDADLPPVRGDRIQLEQVLLNLILNGSEAIVDSGEHDGELMIRTGEQDKQHVLMTVCDSGRGLTKEELEQIFSPFYTTKSGGLGMGLSISRSIIEAHGGMIWASNNQDRGASFFFTLLIDKG